MELFAVRMKMLEKDNLSLKEVSLLTFCMISLSRSSLFCIYCSEVTAPYNQMLYLWYPDSPIPGKNSANLAQMRTCCESVGVSVTVVRFEFWVVRTTAGTLQIIILLLLRGSADVCCYIEFRPHAARQGSLAAAQISSSVGGT